MCKKNCIWHECARDFPAHFSNKVHMCHVFSTKSEGQMSESLGTFNVGVKNRKYGLQHAEIMLAHAERILKGSNLVNLI